MGNIIGIFFVIAIFLGGQCVADIYKEDELHRIRKELKRIADALERRNKE